MLIANLHYGFGEVKFGEIVEPTLFEVQGIERRWDWCRNDDGIYDCTFIISIDGKGSYFNFAASFPDSDGVRRAKPTDLFKCTKR